jgi:large conductance mechanosensitive channel protein
MTENNEKTTEKQVRVRHEVVIGLPRVKVPKILAPLQGFVDFIRQQGVIGLAVGLVIGTQVKVLVDSIVNSFINPIVGLMLPGKGGLDTKILTISVNGKLAIFTWGLFLGQVINFVAVVAVLYFIVKALKLDKLDKKK